MIVGRHHIGERLIVHAIGDPESVAAAADSEHEMPLTVCEPFGGNAARSGDVGQGGSREAGRGRRRYSDRRTEFGAPEGGRLRSEEHTSELQSLMRNSYAVFCLKKNTNT